VSIKEVAEMIVEAMNFTGEVLVSFVSQLVVVRIIGRVDPLNIKIVLLITVSYNNNNVIIIFETPGTLPWV